MDLRTTIFHAENLQSGSIEPAEESAAAISQNTTRNRGIFCGSIRAKRCRAANANQIIEKWESRDEPEHLKTIRDRLLRDEQRAGRLLGIYQQILQGVEVPTDDSREQIELILSGLVVKQSGYLQVKNRIYREVFNREWVEKQLRALRPYSQSFEAWVASKQKMLRAF